MNSYDNGCEGYGVVFCYQTHLMDFTTHPFPLGNGSNADDVHVEAVLHLLLLCCTSLSQSFKAIEVSLREADYLLWLDEFSCTSDEH